MSWYAIFEKINSRGDVYSGRESTFIEAPKGLTTNQWHNGADCGALASSLLKGPLVFLKSRQKCKGKAAYFPHPLYIAAGKYAKKCLG